MAERAFQLPEGLDPEEQRLILASLERYFRPETPRPGRWALAGRMDAAGHGTLQARRFMHAPWDAATRWTFARRGAPPHAGRADAH